MTDEVDFKRLLYEKVAANNRQYHHINKRCFIIMQLQENCQ